MMSKLGLLVRFEAKAGKEKAVEELITSALSLAVKEAFTTTCMHSGSISQPSGFTIPFKMRKEENPTSGEKLRTH